MNDYSNVLTDVANNPATNEITVFVIVLVVALIVFFIPLYSLILKSRKDDRSSDIGEKKLLIDVINRNTEAISTLKVSLDGSNTTIISLLSDISKDNKEIIKDLTKLRNSQDITNGKIDIMSDTDEGLEIHDMLIGINIKMDAMNDKFDTVIGELRKDNNKRLSSTKKTNKTPAKISELTDG